MKIIDVLTENPVITDEIREFFKQKLIKTFEGKDLPASFKEKIEQEGVSLKMLETYLNATPRLICDFMDKKNIILLPLYVQEEFFFSINGEPNKMGFSERHDAEIESVINSIIFYKENYNLSDEKK